jgi:demethylmenaquinone methyltransferase / 2-methoxy-6-polyprenyl-1,4-benzoquinol methylase
MASHVPEASEKQHYVQYMFGRIANRYDLLNKILSLGQDASWRKKVIDMLNPESNRIYLDIGCGTGDLARGIIKTQHTSFVVAADLTYQMVHSGTHHKKGSGILWIVADAQLLPFQRDSFDGIVSGYLLRNVPDLKKTLNEILRVLKPFNKYVSLDTTPPTRNWYYPFVMAYLRIFVPLIGMLISGDRQAYSYLSHSTRNFIPAQELANIFQENDIHSVNCLKLMFGTMAIHYGEKPGVRKILD